MTPVVGFILLTHAHPNQIRRLVDRLNRLFDQPPIVCHHDFLQCPLSIKSFSSNVSFVDPPMRTRWAEFSAVEATVRAMVQMQHRVDRPQWTILLSGSDYPIKSADQILADLNATEADAHMSAELIQPSNLKSVWHREMHNRYYTRWIPMPKSIADALKLNWQRLRLKPEILMRPFVPYNSKLQCYAGSQWFAANQRAIDYIVNFHYTRPQLANHLRWVMFSEETYFQTIVANALDLKINTNDWRYKDWSMGGPHPKTLDQSDLPKLQASSAHFARKFTPDAPVLDDLDRIIFQLE
ncbi:hypothetical protein H6F51_01000 [Cyanobacteria bacterium FACHB-DQ100]|uniref:beta-1,6-N-acetylglucosaminyltransferase n=1 Tax=Leptolyngbya sp. DQ-M1 TaxID=2933920 RepID=UPI0019893FBF|nr:hypothetical protein [Cyanobacteria bacterium FACHB-DQ100]